MALQVVRKARNDDLDDIARIEQQCFPVQEAATKEQIKERMKHFGSHFYVIEYVGTIVGFINGMVTDEETISDEMYEDALLHNEQGRWQSVFGLDVVSEFRNRGFATMLMKALIQDAENEKRDGVILTCKENLIPFYEGLGFQNQGVSASVHGGAVWYDMKYIIMEK